MMRAWQSAISNEKDKIMGLLDAALGSLFATPGAGGTAQPPIAQALESLLQQHGGLGGLVTQLSQGGLASEVGSWIGNGPNQSVSGPQISQALGSGTIGRIAQQLGINPQEAGNLLAQVVPHLVDHMTPGGQLPATGTAAAAPDLLANAVSAIARRLLA
jgi:uncharacterized protein YidB (DUF937 family)